jgi:hypothetical protein
MKSIISPAGTFGGFTEVNTLDDAYEADGTIYPFNVIGEPHSVGKWVPPVVVPVIIVPQAVTMRQARLALNAAGLLSAVQAAIDAGSPESKITWEYSSEVQRNNGLVPMMAALLGMTETQIDNLFIAAEAL